MLWERAKAYSQDLWERVFAEAGLVDDRATKYLASAINVQQLSRDCRRWETPQLRPSWVSTMHSGAIIPDRRGPERGQKACHDRRQCSEVAAIR
jgi:hypothetical protein